MAASRVLSEEQLDAYVGAIYEVAIGDRWIDAQTFDVDSDDLAATLISACNPWSQPLADVDNRRRHAELQRQIEVDGCRWWPARGRSADGSWIETGFLVLAPAATVDAWARQWQQHAVWIVSQLSRTPILRLYSPFAGANPPQQLANMRLEWVGCDPPDPP